MVVAAVVERFLLFLAVTFLADGFPVLADVFPALAGVFSAPAGACEPSGFEPSLGGMDGFDDDRRR